MITRPYLLHALSPLHPGTGTGVGLIDLPIARERTTEHPIVPGSSLKGVLREAARQIGMDVNNIFGTAETSASMVRISDARTLAFPVKSDRGTFAWVTSPYALLRFIRDSGSAAGLSADDIPSVSEGKAVTTDNSSVVDGGKATLDGLPFERVAATVGGKKVLASLPKTAFPKMDPTSSAWRTFFAERLVIVSDDAFTWFTQTATDVRAHVRIDEGTRTVANGALWYTETLPPETILAGIVQVVAVKGSQNPTDVLQLLEQVAADPLQVGGDSTTGAGRVRLVIGGGAM